MVEILHKSGRIRDPDTVLNVLLEHETIDSTGIGHGVAFPHASIEGLKEPVALLAISQRGVDFKAKDEHPVYLFFLFLTPVEETTLHLQILSRATANFTDKSLYHSLRKAKTPQVAISLLLHHEKGGKEVFFPHSIDEKVFMALVIPVHNPGLTRRKYTADKGTLVSLAISEKYF
jgi:mannitol/fructose-specific phosphotransferase system IIA component (Ntr-type)